MDGGKLKGGKEDADDSWKKTYIGLWKPDSPVRHYRYCNYRDGDENRKHHGADTECTVPDSIHIYVYIEEFRGFISSTAWLYVNGKHPL